MVLGCVSVTNAKHLATDLVMQAEAGVQSPLNKGVIRGIVSGSCLVAL